MDRRVEKTSYSFYFASATKKDEEQVMRVTILLRTDGQVHPTPSLTPTQPVYYGIINACFSRFRLERDDSNKTDRRRDGPTDGQSLL